MTMSESQSGHDLRLEEVLTLDEAAAYLRVPKADLAKMAMEGDIPARKIGGDWRFLKQAVIDWLRWGPRFYQEPKLVPPWWILDYPSLEELLQILERRLLDKYGSVEAPPFKRGSKQAVLKHFGVFRDDQDLEERLADAKARREAGGRG
jgi:excisionase family DNA binding protein